MKVVEINNLTKTFGEKKLFVKYSMSVEENEFIVIKGKSGAGKSTLLNIIGLLEKKDMGDIVLFGQKNIKPFSRAASNILKNRIGYLFQNYALVDEETVIYNMKLAIENQKIAHSSDLIKHALNEVGLNNYEMKRVYKCSGGEQQRIAIARLLIKPCDLILADEPTGSLDKENKMLIFDLLLKLKKMGKTLIVVTHDDELVGIADRVIEIV